MKKKRKGEVFEAEPYHRVSPVIATNDEDYQCREGRIGLDEQDREYYVGSELNDISSQSYFRQRLFSR